MRPESSLPRSPLISVCIPTYNGESVVEETIRSVLRSTHREIEVIACDDHSTDGTLEVIERIADSRLRMVENREHLGVPGNWNRAVAEAHGEHLCVLNHDDLIGPSWLSFAAKVLAERAQVDWVASAFAVVGIHGTPMSTITRFPRSGELSRLRVFRQVATLLGLALGCVIRRRALESLGAFRGETGYAADEDLHLRLAAFYSLYYSTTVHTFRRIHENNLSAGWNLSAQAKSGYRILHHIFQMQGLPPEMRQDRRRCLQEFSNRLRIRAEECFKQDQSAEGSAILEAVRENCVI